MKLISSHRVEALIPSGALTTFAVALTALWSFQCCPPAHGQTGNTAYGFDSLNSVTTGDYNSAFGVGALLQDKTGSDNTAVGNSALQGNSAGNANTAVGSAALSFNIGSYNTGTGKNALSVIQGGTFNTASGYQALYSAGNYSTDVLPSYNTAMGAEALYTNAGDFNTAAGSRALYTNSSGAGNTANGYAAMYYNTTGSYNTADGDGALTYNSSGSNNVAVGVNAGVNLTTGNNNIDIGANVAGKAGEANTIRIGKQGTQAATYVAGIYNKTVASAYGVPVYVDNTGHLGTVKSSARYKEQITPMDKASEAILKLEPVTFHYKKELDPDGIRQFGLIAEQVEKVEPELVVRDEDGKVSTVRYEAVNAMLLNEFLKEHRRAEAEHEKVQRLAETVAQQQKQVEALTSAMQKVSAKVQVSQAARDRVAADNCSFCLANSFTDLLESSGTQNAR